jgi:hypothetical protein
VELVKSFENYFLLEKQISAFYNDELNPKFWTKKVSKSGTAEKWVLDPIIRKKLLNIGEDFYDKLKDVVGTAPIYDIQLTGSLANYNYTNLSDLDVHVLVDFNKIKAPRKVIEVAGEGEKFIWNTRHDITMRGHDVEVFLQDAKNPLQKMDLEFKTYIKPFHIPQIIIFNKIDKIKSQSEKHQFELSKKDLIKKLKYAQQIYFVSCLLRLVP